MTMTDTGSISTPATRPPPVPPPLPPSRAGGVFQKFIAPLSFNIGARSHGLQTNQSAGVSPGTTTNRISRHLPSQTTRHRTGIPIAAIDINRTKTHAILAGHEILKTVHVQDGRMVEDFNLRSSINSYASAYGVRSETANLRREYLPAKDVVWSKVDKYDTIIATAALNGRIALYDVNRLNRSRVELAWIHEHSGQINRLDFDPTGGYLLLSGSQDKTVKVWDIRDSQSVRKRNSFNIRHPVRDVRWSPTDAGEFALCTETGIVQRWDLRMPTGAVLSINNAHEKPCYSIDWHPDGRHLVSGGFDKHVRVWDLKSENRRQKPAFELRAPQAVLCIRWRPPCWSSDLAEKGHWQSAQLATSYTDDDPRIHIWDLRRPFLPFREVDRHNRAPSDIVWASEHFLWSVGTEGMFTQTDVRYAPLVQDELSTSAIDFMPDGSFVAFSEDTRERRSSTAGDAAVGFLSIPHERLSDSNDGAISRSFSDDDEGEGLLATSIRKRASRSARSAKSQGNTPPNADGFTSIVPLDRSVLNRSGLFNNDQFGTASSVIGVAEDPKIVKFLAENYALPLTADERRQDPSQILTRLNEAFTKNAELCEYVSLHRVAQSWRILGAIVVPELKDWADTNRRQRLEAEAVRKISPAAFHKPAEVLPLGGPLSRTKVMNNLFRGVTEAEKYGSENESTSNMTTPIAKPLPDSPVVYDRPEHSFLSLNENIEPIPPLPPSVMSAHSTAAAASRALLDTISDNSPASSPEAPRQQFRSPQRHKRNATDIPVSTFDRSLQLQSPSLRPPPKRATSPALPASPRMELRKQEDRRAAIRDFRAQQRQLFTLEEPVQSPRFSTAERHASSESFTMFSASTDSSHRARSIGQSFDLQQDQPRAQRGLEEWQAVRADNTTEPSTLSSNSEILSRPTSNSVSQDSEDGSMHEHFPMDETSRVDFGSDETSDDNQKPVRQKASAAASMWTIGELSKTGNSSQSETAASSASGGVFQFDEAPNVHRPRIYTSNPIRRMVKRTEQVEEKDPSMPHSPIIHQDSGSKKYISSDFRPIDLTTYEPKLPFAWSALPLICHSIAFDISEGIANAQFSVQVLIHLHPFFFNPDLLIKIQPGVPLPDGIAERLMRPDLSSRIVEGLFLNHHLYLKQMSLYRSMAELRNTCVDLGLGAIFRSSTSDQSVGASLKQDHYQLQTSCSHCHSLTPLGTLICANCNRPQDRCPVCLQINLETNKPNTQEINNARHLSSMWTFCQTCGHSSHWACMQEWILQPDSQGECPTLGCGCDCSPGLTRQNRLTRQIADAEAPDLIRGSRSSMSTTRKDPNRASHSPAVDKTRETLRQSEAVRDSSGDERVRRSFSGRAGGRGASSMNVSVSANGGGASGSSTPSVSRSVGGGGGGVSQSLGRRVRLVTPGEQQSASSNSYSPS